MLASCLPARWDGQEALIPQEDPGVKLASDVSHLLEEVLRMRGEASAVLGVAETEPRSPALRARRQIGYEIQVTGAPWVFVEGAHPERPQGHRPAAGQVQGEGDPALDEPLVEGEGAAVAEVCQAAARFAVQPGLEGDGGRFGHQRAHLDDALATAHLLQGPSRTFEDAAHRDPGLGGQLGRHLRGEGIGGRRRPARPAHRRQPRGQELRDLVARQSFEDKHVLRDAVDHRGGNQPRVLLPGAAEAREDQDHAPGHGQV